MDKCNTLNITLLILICIFISCHKYPKTVVNEGIETHACFDNVEAGKKILKEYLDKQDKHSKKAYKLPKNLKIDFNDVFPIIIENCVPCHNDYGHAPFNLTTYRDIKKRALAIKDAVEEGIMPPWFVDDSYTQLFNIPNFNDSIKQVLIKWLDDGCPQVEDLKIQLPNYERNEHPDTLIHVGKTHIIHKDEDTYQCFAFSFRL